MTQPGETGGLSAADHLRALEAYLEAGVIDICVLNSYPIGQGAVGGQVEAGGTPVFCNTKEISLMGVLPVWENLVAVDVSRVRHDPIRLAARIPPGASSSMGPTGASVTSRR